MARGYVRDQWWTTTKNASGETVKTMTTKNPSHPDNADPKVKKRKRQAKRYLALWTGPDGKTASKAFKESGDAEKHVTNSQAAVNQGQYFDASSGAVKLRDYALERWLPSKRRISPNTKANYLQQLRVHILPELGDFQIGHISRVMVEDFVTRLDDTLKLKPKTVELVFSVLRSVMMDAVRNKLIRDNPCSNIELPEDVEDEDTIITVLTADNVRALADCITERYRVSVWIGAGLGLRIGEASGLTRDNVKGLKGRTFAHVVQQAQKGVLTTRLKSRKSKRILPVDDLVLDEVNTHIAKFGTGPSEVIMTSATGRIVPSTTFSRCFKQAVMDAELPMETTFHDLRHFYASTLIAGNMNPKVIQARMGHNSIQQTFDVYGHLFPDDVDMGRGVIAAAFTAAKQDHEATAKPKIM